MEQFVTVTLGEVIQAGGLLGGLWFFVRYLMKRDEQNTDLTIKRERALIVRLESVEDYQKDTMHGLVTKSVEALAGNTAALHEFSDTAKHMPCRYEPQLKKGNG